MIPWILERANASGPLSKPYFDGRSHSNVLFALTTLLWEIEQSPKERQRLLVVAAPRSQVWTGYGNPLYLFRGRSRAPFASFESHGGRITTVGFRYNDPMDPASGRRQGPIILTGWQGTAELIASAVRHSRLWKRLETVETDSWNDDGIDRVTYDVWATPRYCREILWRAGDRYLDGHLFFEPCKPIRLAEVVVFRRYVGDYIVEEVQGTQLYPDLAGIEHYDDYDGWGNREDYVYNGGGLYGNPNWYGGYWHTESANLPAPLFVDISGHMLPRIQPHDGFELDINWV